jgi:uncharacterized protein
MSNAKNKTHEDLVADWQQGAESSDDDNYLFLRRVKQRSSSTKVDRIALQLHEEAFSIVDCTKCANCCRTLRIMVTDKDIPRIARHLEMAEEEFIAAYLERDEIEGGFHIKTTPCPFLAKDNRCTIHLRTATREMPGLPLHG